MSKCTASTLLCNIGKDSSKHLCLYLSVNISHTRCDIQERDDHSARTYYISEQLPQEACPVILGELLWRHVMSIGNEEGVVGYQATAAQRKLATTQEELRIRSQSLLLISISFVFVMQIWKVHLRNQQ